MNDYFSFVIPAGSLSRIFVLIFIGIPLVKWCSKLLTTLCLKRFSRHATVLVGHIIFYGGLSFIGITVLHELGFNISALLGAAGVFGVAIGFASQTSISNIISGFFLLLECPFLVGDKIKSCDVVGYVEEIDLLSVRIRTADNTLIRLPNEAVLKHSVVNYTHYTIKRIDYIISLPYTNDIQEAQHIIYDIIQKNSSFFCKEPVPTVRLQGIEQPYNTNEVRIFLIVHVWVLTEKFSSVSAILMEQLKNQFDIHKSTITIVQKN
ncbi:MAG TPA: mechanosensitive ion channel family protein [Candidatus Babeliales bacterium]|nr:mechanosensitive ion channel family protein [Candidatus Babeliales bacterium]